MKKLILATGNSGKVRELDAMLSGVYEVISQKELGVNEVPETGLSFVENALIKARNASKQTGLPALADDSGLVVDALSGAPGIYSARYAGKGASDEENLQKLLSDLKRNNNDNRRARFWCALTFVQHCQDPTPVIIQRGWEGEIIDEVRGEGGFGYDPIFYVPSHGCTSAELSPEEKNKISHRGQALQAFLEQLKD
ncbi:MAG TPA: RdgB/HAM1 family non-canonical purine NTP pyrophosphatase [Candidatus Thioglobus sp.]|jgi:XTP/dITP diphosphohydrolase|nr:RdgB/HAM1 family non-canonical purine NTP pyrophosphatase [Candidatus Thioglobus sp.]HIL20090.1 RdgB/HAM1 family non-canonical purine NTP pyrophosphatase [Candidatus Thioglobus sp.]